uniref:Uncharacterized protein n=1 Tax=Clytia hemisphaerica TaxID=252671 RepID=A0A7M5V9I4_9CNID
MMAVHHRNLERAIINQGTYKLAPGFEHYLIDNETWDLMTNEEKDAKKAQFCGKFPSLYKCRDDLIQDRSTPIPHVPATPRNSSAEIPDRSTLIGEVPATPRNINMEDDCQPSTSGLQVIDEYPTDEEDTSISHQPLSVSSNMGISPPEFPDFSVSGLPGHLSVDWNGAKQYLVN